MGHSRENLVRCPDTETAAKMQKLIETVRDDGDTVSRNCDWCDIDGSPIGLGEPVFHKLEADLAHAMLSINATKGLKFGSGFGATQMKGSEHNDRWIQSNLGTTTSTNHSGGIQGGISN